MHFNETVVEPKLADEGQAVQNVPITTSELIEKLQDPSKSLKARAEIDRRIKGNKATHLAVRYLLGGLKEREDAFDGLVALCWVAKKNLRIYPTENEIAQGMTEYRCTREFIQDFVLDFLDPFWRKTEIEVLYAALTDKFRYIGHRVRSRMVSEIIRREAPKNQEPKRWRVEDMDSVSLDLPPGAECTTSSLNPGNVVPTHHSASTYAAFLEPRKESLTNTLGDKGYEVLMSHLDIFPDGYEGTDQRTKSALTQAIARRRQVSEQQARADKRQFQESVEAAKRAGNPEVTDFYLLLSRGDDDNTLRIEWVNHKGRKGSVRLHVPLSFHGRRTDKDVQGTITPVERREPKADRSIPSD